MGHHDTTVGLEDVLRSAPRSMAEETILLTGVLLRADSPDQFTLQHRASSWSVYSVFRKSDVVGPVIAVPQSLLSLSEFGQGIHAIRLKKGAPGILFTERVHRVGDHPLTPTILKEYSSTDGFGGVPAQFAPLQEILDKAPRGLNSVYGVFPGVIHPGVEQDEILLQVNPPGNLDYAIIKRADIVDPASIQELAQETLPLSKRGYRIHLVRVREGARIRAITGMQARVEKQPRNECECSCFDEQETLSRVANDAKMEAIEPEKRLGHHAHRHVLAEGRRCGTTVCLNAKGKWDYCCANELAPCDYQWATGFCTTADHWLWGVRCFCAAEWAPL